MDDMDEKDDKFVLNLAFLQEEDEFSHYASIKIKP